MSPEKKFIAIIGNDRLIKADAIVVLEGDGLARLPEGARLYKEGWAPLVVLSGGLPTSSRAVHSNEMVPSLVTLGVPEEAILVEGRSQHTRGQGEEIAKLAQQKRWNKIILVASHYHQYRAYLTFLKAFADAERLDRSVILINAPARDLPWFKDEPPSARAQRLVDEFKKIETYRAQGHVASWEEALDYLEWKESKLSL